MRKSTWLSVLTLAFLLVSALNLTAAELKIQSLGMVRPGADLRFSAVITIRQAACPQGFSTPTAGVYYIVNGPDGWVSDMLIFDDAATNPITINFTKTFTVPGNASGALCFELFAHSMCWAPELRSQDKKCLNVVDFIKSNRLWDIQFLEFNPFPDCPACAQIDLAVLSERVGEPIDPLDLILLYNGRQVAVLGKAMKGAKLPASVKITLPDDPLNAIAKGGGMAAGFQIRLINAAGRAVALQNLSLKRR